MKQHYSLKKAAFRIPLILALLLVASGCRISHIFHAAAGQARLLAGAVPVEEGLHDGRLSREEKERLRLVSQIKAFGEEALGLKKTRNFETVYLKSPGPPLYVVSACPKDRLQPVTWWFPIVGEMPYLGFFNLRGARNEARNLTEKGLDVCIGTAEAYSTLGWFRDPITLNLLKGSTLDLVETVLHEMAHSTLYIKGQGAFNEGLAVLVGKVGALSFLEAYYGKEHHLVLEARNSIHDERLFSTFLDDLLARLEDLYQSPLSLEEKMERRGHIFKKAREAFEQLKPRFKTDRFGGFGRLSLNNASLVTIGLYHRYFPLFEWAFKKNGRSIKKMIDYFRALSARPGDLIQNIMLERSLLRSSSPRETLGRGVGRRKKPCPPPGERSPVGGTPG